jgi:hypothetical protein
MRGDDIDFDAGFAERSERAGLVGPGRSYPAEHDAGAQARRVGDVRHGEKSIDDVLIESWTIGSTN